MASTFLEVRLQVLQFKIPLIEELELALCQEPSVAQVEALEEDLHVAPVGLGEAGALHQLPLVHLPVAVAVNLVECFDGAFVVPVCPALELGYGDVGPRVKLAQRDPAGAVRIKSPPDSSSVHFCSLEVRLQLPTGGVRQQTALDLLANLR
eukprot:CAMPEP_0168481014 /NCGR_PEP_ID=MMETSP0228-20121227/64293_1 /TAXON_ID=133427 /ORGANISM="Protoceratium reticulatum, Strain CCCM 535 (=CCMP 1889)" /LENGTH=150 /DNA_ID=CAMNT_0008497369 /DNA_START=106 /DNA_END=555 /DNA_ORIENTATION=+